jgi:A/G-specific adenine glycosylase
MGYNNRAVRLHRLARFVVEFYNGRLPAESKLLAELPGLGPYTVNAMLCSAFGKEVPVVDVNIRRSLSRLFWPMRSTSDLRPEREIWKLTEGLLPRNRAYAWNQALMDLGALVCTARKPLCAECPVSLFCRSRNVMKNVRVQKSTVEPSRYGIPNRIYRGKIIRMLADRPGARAVTPEILGRHIRAGFSRRDRLWLMGLLRSLQNDGLIGIRSKGGMAHDEVYLS